MFAVLASEKEIMAHENKTESKVGSHTTGDKNVRIQIGLNMQPWATKPYKVSVCQIQPYSA